MYAIKMIWVMDGEAGQPIELLQGEKVFYENIACKNEAALWDSIKEKAGDSFQVHGHEPKKPRTEPFNYVFMRLWLGSHWEYHLIRDCWIYVMLNGKTIEKIDIVI